MRKFWSCVVALPLLLAASAPASTQEKDKEKDKEPAPRAARKMPQPLRVHVTFMKFQGDKKVASLPYTLALNADDPQYRNTRLRMGINVPIVTTIENKPQVVYKSVGTNIDCSADILEDGRVRLQLTTEQSSLYAADGQTAWAVGDQTVGKQPVLRDFSSSITTVLRDGQSALHTAATDPLSGETVKIEVSVSIVK